MDPALVLQKVTLIALAIFTASTAATGTPNAAEPNAATAATKAANAELEKFLPFGNQEDFELTKRGFLAALEPPVIKDDDGNVVYDLTQFEFLDSDRPDTVNPSLWRQSQLNAKHGLFKVTDRIYQLRAYDLANMSLIQGDSGWIIIDPLTAAETAKATLALANEKLGSRPVVAVIYTHSHVDHFGGVRGVVDEKDVEAGKVKIIAPEGFMEEAIAENVMAGNVMSRRASYMYGNLVPKGPMGTLGSGLGTTTAAGRIGVIEPTDIISETGTRMTVDGVEIIFQNTPGAEAPAEMMFYFPQFKTLCASEDVNSTLHNLYTLRGAKVRDALKWSQYIHEAIALFGDDAEVAFGSHHWPRWGNEKIVAWLKKQRDLYKYIHDQTLRLANQGYTMIEIAEMIELPESLATEFFNRGYYGSVNHDVKAVYQRYLGWFDGNPANLHSLPPKESSEKYVEFMGGADAVLSKAREAFGKGEYRWVAQVVNHVVFANPNNTAARELQADALEQLGYQAESGPWRNFYLSGAKELRDGVLKAATPDTASPDFVRAMPLDLYFDYLSIRVNGPKAAGKTYTFNADFTDTGQKYFLELGNGVLNYSADEQAKDPDATVHISRKALDDIALGLATFAEKVDAGEARVDGNRAAWEEFLSTLDTFEFWFNIVTP